jgi:hypothetical protein
LHMRQAAASQHGQVSQQQQQGTRRSSGDSSSSSHLRRPRHQHQALPAVNAVPAGSNSAKGEWRGDVYMCRWFEPGQVW